MSVKCQCDVCQRDTGTIRTACHDDGTPYGYLGSSAWRRDVDAASSARRIERIEQLTSAGRAQVLDAAGRPTGDPMPSPVVEPVEPMRTVEPVEYVEVERPMPIAVRRYVALARRYGVERRRRHSIMVAAQRRASAALTAARANVEVERIAPLVTVTEDMRKWHTKRVRLDESGQYSTLVFWSHSRRAAPMPLDPMSAVEGHIMQRDRDHAAWSSIASSEPNRDGRGTVERCPDAVNGTEVRHSARWHSTPRASIMTVVERRDGIACVGPVDWTPYRVAADGTRTPLVSSSTAKRRKSSAKLTSKQARTAKLAAIAGTLGVDAQG